MIALNLFMKDVKITHNHDYAEFIHERRQAYKYRIMIALNSFMTDVKLIQNYDYTELTHKRRQTDTASCMY